MSNLNIKRVAISQIRYTPEEGEIVRNTTDDKFYIYHDGAWTTIDMENSGINMGLYDINKQIISQLPTLTEFEDKKNIIKSLDEKFENVFYMLYGKEISYFTLFQIIHSEKFGDEVIDCLKNIGDIKAIDLTEAEDAVEIWVHGENGPTCLYLFPYDSGLVKVMR